MARLAGLSGKMITEAAREGDEIALAGFNTLGYWIGAGVACSRSFLILN
jgi:glucokinase